MEIRYSDGRRRAVETEDEARRVLDAEYPEVVYSDEQAGGAGERRILVWADEDDAGPEGLGDDGQNAVASIVWPEED